MMRGLVHLHKPTATKPSVLHRDVVHYIKRYNSMPTVTKPHVLHSDGLLHKVQSIKYKVYGAAQRQSFVLSIKYTELGSDGLPYKV